MNDLKIVTYSSKYQQIWNDFLKISKNGTFLFDRDFMEYHQDRFEDVSLLIFKNGEVVALLPANKVDNIVYSHQGLTYGGLVVSSKLKFHAILECFKEVLKYYSEKGYTSFQVKILPAIYNKQPSDDILYLMHILDAKLIRRDLLSVVNQSNPITYSKDRKDGVKRAKKANLIIKSNDAFDDFWNEILIPNLQKKHGVNPVHSLDEIKLLKKRFPKSIMQFNVYDKQKIIAGTTIFITEKVAHSQYISADETKNKTGSLDFLHDYLLKEVFKEKPYFDFGISNENNGFKVNSGLQYWKEGFGARAVVQDFYQLPIENYKRLDAVLI